MRDNNNPKDVLSMEKTVAGLQWKKARKRELAVSVSTPGNSVPPLPENSVPVIPEQYVPPAPE